MSHSTVVKSTISDDPERSAVKSLRKALTVLNAVAGADRPLTVTVKPEDSSAHTATYTYDGEFPKTLSVTGPGQLVNDVDYNHRRQLTSIERQGSDPDTTLTYHNQSEGFRLSGISVNDTAARCPISPMAAMITWAIWSN